MIFIGLAYLLSPSNDVVLRLILVAKARKSTEYLCERCYELYETTKEDVYVSLVGRG